MKSIIRGSAVTLAALPLWLSAHTMNLLPSHFVQAKTGSFVSVELFASNTTFQADKGTPVDGFQLYLPDGSVGKVQGSYQGKRKSLVDVALPVDGTYRLQNGGQPRFFTSYELNGEKKRLMGDKQKAAAELPKGASNVVTTQGRNKALAFVTVNAPTDTVLKPSGQGLEFTLDKHPADIVAGEAVTVTVLFDGKPASGVDSELMFDGELYRNEAGRQHFKTDAKGQFSFTPQSAGRYLLEAALEKDLKSAKADKIREGFTWAFEASMP
ncbi:MAG TPA: DUF4198 domain-containing protein [Rheinheimera sp.]|nr:DUF4198 domain-containing protein [Rheinheimera sp.]